MKKIFVYSGPGVSRQSLLHFEHLSFSKFLCEKIEIKALLEGDWKKEADLFVLLGGADLPYCRLLNGLGNKQIRSFVQEGGRYLGICAGSYYAGNFVEFAKGTNQEVIGRRELGFFPGMVQGPTFPPFEYVSLVGARLVKLTTSLSKQSPLCFYQGGGHFCIPQKKESIEVLATYKEAEGEPPAVVLCSVGKGAALLSGVHFEYDPDLMEKQGGFCSKMISQMREKNQDRLVFVQKCFEKLNL